MKKFKNNIDKKQLSPHPTFPTGRGAVVGCNLLHQLSAFTIAEVTLALMIMAVIAAFTLPSLVRGNDSKILYTALDKNYTYFQQVTQAIPMLQMKGKIAPGAIDADKFMQAIVLTSKCIDLKTDGTQITFANRKFATYTNGYAGALGTGQYSAYSFDAANLNNNTIILKNNVIISRKTDGGITYIIIDVNGNKTPNRTGRDIFVFTVDDGVLTSAPNNDGTYTCTVGDSVANTAGCAGKYLQAGGME